MEKREKKAEKKRRQKESRAAVAAAEAAKAAPGAAAEAAEAAEAAAGATVEAAVAVEAELRRGDLVGASATYPAVSMQALAASEAGPEIASTTGLQGGSTMRPPCIEDQIIIQRCLGLGQVPLHCKVQNTLVPWFPL